jgi:putative peptidoglycan lipid II flippase
MISRILGYLRDALVASYFGGGGQTDAFYAAFKIPNLFRRFLGEGSLTAAFVPVFTQTNKEKGREEANELFNALASGLLIILLVLVILGVLFAPQITQLVSWGFTRDPEKFALTTNLTRLLFPFLLIICMAALLTSVLNASGKFFVPALAPSGLSIAEILFVLFIAHKLKFPLYGLAISALVGVLIHFVWQIPSLYKAGYRFKFVVPFSHPKVKTVFLLMIPTVIGLCADQINSFVDQFCASFLRDGSVTALYNSSRIMQLPLALFGIAIASVSLPALAESANDKNAEEFKDMLGFSLRLANFVLIPSLVGLIVLGLPIVQMLFQHGRFTSEYSLLTFRALVPAAAGLPAYSATKILASAFYAHKNTKTPVHVAFWAMLINVILSVMLMWKYDVAGLATATSISAWFQTVVLFILLRNKLGLLGGKYIVKSFVVSAGLSLILAIVCVFTMKFTQGFLPLFPALLVSISLGALSYFSAAKIFKVPELNYLVKAFLRKK